MKLTILLRNLKVYVKRMKNMYKVYKINILKNSYIAYDMCL